MASDYSTMSGASQSSNAASSSFGGQRRRCLCGLNAPLRTSLTENSFGMQFFTCPKYKPDQCSFFEWYGPPTCARGREVARKVKEKISKLEGKIKDLEDEIKEYKRNERITKELEGKNKELEDEIKAYKTNERMAKRKDKIVVQVLFGLCLIVVMIIVNNVFNVKHGISRYYLP